MRFFRGTLCICLIICIFGVSISIDNVCTQFGMSLSLNPVFVHRTYGNAGYEFFQINSKPFLAVANFWDGQDRHMGAYSEILPLKYDVNENQIRANGSMRIWTQGAHGVDFFEIKPQENGLSKRFLVYPNYYGCEGVGKRPCDATTILDWNENTQKFQIFQVLASDGPSQTDHFTIPNTNSHYLVVAENFASKISIYRYDEKLDSFLLEQSLVCAGVAAIAIIALPDRILLAAASYHDPKTQWKTKSSIFSWFFHQHQQSHFQQIQKLSTQGAHDVEMILYPPFSSNNQELLLFFSEDRNEKSPIIESQVFKYNFENNQFYKLQGITTDGAHAAEMFIIPNTNTNLLFLIIANFGDRHGKRYEAHSSLFIFSHEKQQFLPIIDDIPTIGATDWEYFHWNGHHYLAVSNEGDLENQFDPSTDSPVYELQFHNCPNPIVLNDEL